MRKIELTETLAKILDKLEHKDKVRFEAILKKIEEIAASEHPEHYKNLRYGMRELQRVHIDSSFVLVFRISDTTAKFYDLQHHDDMYRR